MRRVDARAGRLPVNASGHQLSVWRRHDSSAIGARYLALTHVQRHEGASRRGLVRLPLRSIAMDALLPDGLC